MKAFSKDRRRFDSRMPPTRNHGTNGINSSNSHKTFQLVRPGPFVCNIAITSRGFKRTLRTVMEVAVVSGRAFGTDRKIVIRRQRLFRTFRGFQNTPKSNFLGKRWLVTPLRKSREFLAKKTLRGEDI